MKKALLISITGVFSVVFVLWLFLTFQGVPGHREFKNALMKKLVRIEPLPDVFWKPPSNSDNVIYVLGGGQNSLRNRFETAADLYRRGLSKKILFLDRPGITQYNALLSRNLTNNEWAIKRLVALGVKKEDAEPVSLRKGFFGTFTEAKGIPDIVFKRGYKRLILVTSSYHTMRVWKSFSEFARERNIDLYIYMSSEPVDLRELLLEYFKLLVYTNFLL
ncbi:MAG: YdcF family protein [Deferribacteres bacterium]|nr:YdcF family protein [Deferribacteres bacterium]